MSGAEAQHNRNIEAEDRFREAQDRLREAQDQGRSTQAREIMELFRTLNDEGTTIVQVTHSECNAAHGSRTLQMRDGWLVADTASPMMEPNPVAVNG